MALLPTIALVYDFLFPVNTHFLEISVITANGSLITLCTVRLDNPVLTVFWAMRSGEAGSWGVMVSATFQTFPAFDAAISCYMAISANTTHSIYSTLTLFEEVIFRRP